MIMMMNNKKNIVTRILLVDNEPDNTSVLSMGLEDEGFKVDVFNDPVLALSNFKPNFYALSILDINMPKMNGYELYKEIRKIDDKVKVCFLTVSKSYQGTGLGLYISKGIVEAHGGKIWAENNDGANGAIFAFSLPGIGTNTLVDQ